MTGEDAEFYGSAYDFDEDDYFDDDLANEKYYWKTADNKIIKVDDLEESHIINIVIKFGKDKLNQSGYKNILNRFEEIRKKRNF